MIDVIEAVRKAEPSLGPHVLVLRGDARSLAAQDSFTPEASAWIEGHAPQARLAQVDVLLSPYPGAPPEARTLTVVAFAEAVHLRAFVTAWTGDPPEDDAPSP